MKLMYIYNLWTVC